MPVEQPARSVRLDLATESVEKRGSHHPLQRGHALADRCGRQMDSLGRPGDATQLGDLTEYLELTEIEAGGALRGLSPMAKKYAENEDVPAWALKAVEDMQGLKLSEKELDAFAREGGLGEYGEE